MENDKRKIIKSCFAAAGLTLAVIVTVFGINGALPGGDKTFAYGDAIIQYIPIIKMFLRHLFGGESLIYSFEAGMGMPTVALYAYYCMSPFNLLLLLIRDPDIAYFALFSFKLMCASAAMAFLLSKSRNISILTTAVLSNAYVLCGFVFNFTFGIIFFDMMILMPLLLFALMDFVKTKRMVMLSIVYALCFIIHFYSGYMLGIFSFVLFLCLAGKEYGKDVKKWGEAFLKYAISVFVAVLLSAPLLLPTAMELFGHLGTDSTVLDGLQLSVSDFLTSFYPGVTQIVYNTVPMIYFGLLPLLLFIVFMVDKGKTLREKVFALIPIMFLLICSFWKYAYLMIHAFDAPDGYCFRFSWLFGFWIIYIAAEEFEQSFKQHSASVIGGVLILLYFVIYILQVNVFKNPGAVVTLSNGVMAAMFLLLYSGILWISKKKGDMVILLDLILVVETICNGVVMESAFSDDKTQDGKYYKIWTEQGNMAMQYIKEEEKKDPSAFYRVYYGNGAGENVAMLLGFKGVGWFLSIENENVRSLMDTLGYATSSRKVQDYGSTDVTRMLLSQKYSVQCGSYYGEHPEYYSVVKNDRVLPPAYLVSEAVAELELVKKDPFAAQEQLAEAMTGERYDLWKVYDDSYLVKPEGISWMPYDGGVILQRESAEEYGKITYTFLNEGDESIYVYVSREPRSADDADSPLLFSDMDLGGIINRPRLFMPRIFPASRNEEGAWECFLYMTDWGYEVADYSKLYYASLNKGELDRLYDKLSTGGINLSSVSEAEWRGTVEVTDDRSILLTTIPYDEGWEIYVDGERAEAISLLGGAFLGVHLEKGSHEINIVFRNMWLLSGVVCGIAGIAALVAFCLAERKKSVD